MKKLSTVLGLASLLAFATGCWRKESAPHLVDHLSFHFIGGTLFTNPDLLTMKEIHLDNGTLTGREIIVEGKVAEVSPHGTYLVLVDDTARMMVVLTDMESGAPFLKAEKPKTLRVLGTVDAAVTPRVTAKHAPPGEQRPLQKPVSPECVERVLGAAGVVLARPRRRQQAERVAPGVNEADADDPHALAFPSTSVTCSTSHAWPRESAGSAIPGRAART